MHQLEETACEVLEEGALPDCSVKLGVIIRMQYSGRVTVFNFIQLYQEHVPRHSEDPRPNGRDDTPHFPARRESLTNSCINHASVKLGTHALYAVDGLLGLSYRKRHHWRYCNHTPQDGLGMRVPDWHASQCI
jgi:hypothetical protein